MKRAKEIYKRLKERYGKPGGQWDLWCKRPKNIKEREEVIIEAVLTQRANWRNVQLAMKNLKKVNADSIKGILALGVSRLAPLIKPSGFYKAKSEYLIILLKFIVENYGNVAKAMEEDLKYLRRELIKLKGIGRETADDILLYALDKPVFVIDEYTRRLVKAEKMADNLSYDFLQKLFEDSLKRDFRLYQDFHALIVIGGKDGYKL